MSISSNIPLNPIHTIRRNPALHIDPEFARIAINGGLQPFSVQKSVIGTKDTGMAPRADIPAFVILRFIGRKR